MCKSYLPWIVALLFTAGAAHAQSQTVTLEQTNCTATNICYNVPNSASLTIDYVDWAAQYKRLLVSVNGEIYDSGLWAVSGALSNVPLYSGSGAVIYATLEFNTVIGPCVRQGRVTNCKHTVTLVSGSLLM
jgi:hypothetical protein